MHSFEARAGTEGPRSRLTIPTESAASLRNTSYGHQAGTAEEHIDHIQR